MSIRYLDSSSTFRLQEYLYANTLPNQGLPFHVILSNLFGETLALLQDWLEPLPEKLVLADQAFIHAVFLSQFYPHLSLQLVRRLIFFNQTSQPLNFLIFLWDCLMNRDDHLSLLLYVCYLLLFELHLIQELLFLYRGELPSPSWLRTHHICICNYQRLVWIIREIICDNRLRTHHIYICIYQQLVWII
jgi:hypothetical protein